MPVTFYVFLRKDNYFLECISKRKKYFRFRVMFVLHKQVFSFQDIEPGQSYFTEGSNKAVRLSVKKQLL